MGKRTAFARRALGRRPPRRRGRGVRLELQVLAGTSTPDTRGHTQRAHATRATVYAYVRQLDGEEATLAREIVPRATHQVEIDYDARCKPRARFKFPNESRYLNIESVDNFEERNRHMVCVCVEEVST